MTLAAAICFPPDILRNFERASGNENLFERAVILAADSLYSDKQGRPVDERGLKLVRIAQNTGAVFAGDIEYTKEAIDEFKRVLFGHGALTLDQFGKRAQSYFDAHVPDNTDSACLIGFVDSDSNPHILKLTSRDRFRPQYSDSIEIIGASNEASEMFVSLYSDHSRLPGSNSTPTQTGLRAVEALDSTIQKHYPTVGGQVQAGIVTKDKMLSITGLDIDLAALDDIRRFTLRPDETR